MAQVVEREIPALGLMTRVLEAGLNDSEEAVVFLHGQPGSADDWRDLMGRVAPLGRVVAFDWPGWGSAERPTKDNWDFSAGVSAMFLADMLSRLGIRRAHLVMHDLGGVGLLWAAAHPDAVVSAVLIDTGVLIDFRWHPVARLMRAPLIGGAGIRMTTRSGFRAFMRYYNPQPRPLPEEVLERWWSDFTLPTRRAMLAFYRATPEKVFERLVEPLAHQDVPALVVWGAHDPAVTVEQAWHQRKSFPSAEVVVLDDSGHWPYLDDPEGTAGAVVPFLERRLAG
jgi:pimeloyl-ACP methyl ester carboxylesterase